MKKFLFMTMIAALLSSGAFAKGSLTVKSGTNVLKNDATATLTIDFSAAVWEDQGDFKTWSADNYELFVETAQKALTDGINNNSKKFKITGRDEAQYTMVYKLSKLEQHQEFSAMWGRLSMYTSGTIEIVDNQSGEVVFAVEVSKQVGQPDYKTEDRLYKAFEVLGYQLTKLKK